MKRHITSVNYVNSESKLDKQITFFTYNDASPTGIIDADIKHK